MSSQSTSTQKRRKVSAPVSRISTLKLETLDYEPPTKKLKLKPLTALSKPPVFNLNGSGNPNSSQKSSAKGKEKARPKFDAAPEEEEEKEACKEEGLWIDMYEPLTESDLAIHARKFKDVKQWFIEALEGGPTGKLRKYRKILVLSGPAGTAKTAAVRVLARELGFDIMEWRNTTDERFLGNDELEDNYDSVDGLEYEGLADKFHSFLARASNCNTIFGPSILPLSQTSQATSSQSSQRFSQSANSNNSRRIVLLEDLPNILHPPTQASFHSSLQSVVAQSLTAPIVIVVSDAGVRGEEDPDGVSSSQWRSRGAEVVNIRTVLPPSLTNSPYVTHISFNPIAPTLMKKALQTLLAKHFSSSLYKAKPPSKDVLDLIVDTSNGDIRSAVMALQFACGTGGSDSVTVKGKGRAKKGTNSTSSRALLEVMSRREQNLALFHLLGKILYNKRKGDPPASSASAKDAQRDKDLDLKLKDPPRLPSYLAEHDRRASRVDVEALYADSPIDASLLSLYIQHNYTQYCNTLAECDGVIDWLSWVDSSGGESWLHANPHRFHLVTLGTMHSLPTPVPRKGQKPYKPEFFDNIKATRESEDGLRDVQAWLQGLELGGSWTRRNIALEMGGVLKAYDKSGSNMLRPPRSHSKFSRMEFVRGMINTTDIVDDQDLGPSPSQMDEREPFHRSQSYSHDFDQPSGGWLETDDIEDF